MRIYTNLKNRFLNISKKLQLSDYIHIDEKNNELKVTNINKINTECLGLSFLEKDKHKLIEFDNKVLLSDGGLLISKKREYSYESNTTNLDENIYTTKQYAKFSMYKIHYNQDELEYIYKIKDKMLDENYKYYITMEYNQKFIFHIKNDILYIEEKLENFNIKEIQTAEEYFIKYYSSKNKPYMLIETLDKFKDYLSKKCSIKDWCFMEVCKLLKEYHKSEAFYEFAFNITSIESYNKLKAYLEEIKDSDILYLILHKNFKGD